MKLEVYADLVCPWCYVGKRRLEKALASYAGADDVELSWWPYQLDPEAGTEPVPHLTALEQKLGPEPAAAALAEIQAAAAGEGIDLRLDRAQRANTFDAHRVVALALAEAGSEVQHRVVERLMRAYFTEGRDIADHAELAALAAEAGLTGVDVQAYLASTAGVEDVRQALEEGRALGLDAVPTYVFERRWAVSGAQSPEVMGQVLLTIEAALLGGGGGCCGGGGGGCACSRSA